LLAFLLLAACLDVDEKEALGAYVAQNYVNTIDTIFLEPAGEYERRVYASDGKLVLRMRSKWSISGTREISFDAFFLNLDRNLLKYPELIADTDRVESSILESNGGSLEFCVGYLENQNCYRKVPSSGASVRPKEE